MSEDRPNEPPTGLKQRGKRIGLMVGAIVISVLLFAWFHGGEEPLHSIVQPIATPEHVQ